MKVRFKTTARGPNTYANWSVGDIRDVPAEQAANLVKLGYAEALEPFPVAKPAPVLEVAENPAPTQAETATVKPHRGRRPKGE